MVRVVWCGDHNQSNVRQAKRFLGAGQNPRVGIEFGRFVAAAFKNRGKPQARNSTNHRRMKRAPRQSKSDESDVDHPRWQLLYADVERTRSRATQLPRLRVKFASGGLLLQNV